MKRVQLILMLLAIITVSSLGPARGYAQMSGLTVYDANNQEVGKVVGFLPITAVSKPPTVAPKARQQRDVDMEVREEGSKSLSLAPLALFRAGRAWVPLVVTRSALSQLTATNVQPTVFFESTDCTGAPFVQPVPGPDSLIPRVEIIVDKAYVQDLQAKVRKVSARSLLVSDGKTKECSPGGGALDLAPATPVDFKFTPPFSLR